LSLRSANPTADIYTVEAIRQRAVFALPVLAVSMATSIILAVLGGRDENADKAAGNVDFGKNTPEGELNRNSIGGDYYEKGDRCCLNPGRCPWIMLLWKKHQEGRRVRNKTR
jgi:hypothetical protein